MTKNQALSQALDATERYLVLQEKAADAMREGFWRLTKAQHVLGYTRVSRLQHPSDEIEPSLVLDQWEILHKPSQEPLKRYGMAPQSLYESKTKFEEAIDILIEAAQEQLKLRALLRRYLYTDEQ